MEGNLVDSEEKNIKGDVTFRWLPGEFFLENRTELNFNVPYDISASRRRS